MCLGDRSHYDGVPLPHIEEALCVRPGVCVFVTECDKCGGFGERLNSCLVWA